MNGEYKLMILFASFFFFFSKNKHKEYGYYNRIESQLRFWVTCINTLYYNTAQAQHFCEICCTLPENLNLLETTAQALE